MSGAGLLIQIESEIKKLNEAPDRYSIWDHVNGIEPPVAWNDILKSEIDSISMQKVLAFIASESQKNPDRAINLRFAILDHCSVLTMHWPLQLMRTILSDKAIKAVINAHTESGQTLLHAAALARNTLVMDLLLQHGADPRVPNEDRQNVAQMCCENTLGPEILARALSKHTKDELAAFKTSLEAQAGDLERSEAYQDYVVALQILPILNEMEGLRIFATARTKEGSMTPAADLHNKDGDKSLLRLIGSFLTGDDSNVDRDLQPQYRKQLTWYLNFVIEKLPGAIKKSKDPAEKVQLEAKLEQAKTSLRDVTGAPRRPSKGPKGV